MNIAVVGAGNGGRNIINSFSKNKDIKIRLVVDKNQSAPGIILAREIGIKCSDSLEGLAYENIDLIIEVTGNKQVADIIRSRYGDRCEIIGSAGALLVMNLVQRDMETVERLNNQVKAINDTASVVDEQLNGIVKSVESISTVSDKLSSFSKTSDMYLDRIGEIIKYVNKIAQQTKVLGINAKIEAMRAGEQGRTFSIVASEIQDLAKDSEDNAKEIKGILLKLLDEIKSLNFTVESLEELSKLQMNASEHMESAMASLLRDTGKN